MFSETVWPALRICCIKLYFAFSNFIAHDGGKNFMGAAFRANADELYNRTKSIPVESANTVAVVDRYHVPIRLAFNIQRKESFNPGKKIALLMAVKAINDSIGSGVPVSTILVFDALLRLNLPADGFTPSTLKRAAALQKATTAMSKFFASRQIRDVLKNLDSPDVSKNQRTPIGAHMHVFRPEKTDGKKGTHLLISEEKISLCSPVKEHRRFAAQ